MSDSYKYRPLAALTWVVVVLLGLGVMEGIANLYSSWRQLEMLERGDFSQAEADANDARQQALAFASIGIRLVTVVCFGMWIVRANRNVRALGAAYLPITPGWAVGYFFVPILNLFRPFQAMRDLVKASRNPANWKRESGSSILPLWWALWLISNVVNQIAFRMGRGENHTLTSLREVTQVLMVGEMVEIPLCFAAIGLVLLITRCQEAAPPAPSTSIPDWPAEHWRSAGREDDDNIVRGGRREY